MKFLCAYSKNGSTFIISSFISRLLLSSDILKRGLRKTVVVEGGEAVVEAIITTTTEAEEMARTTEAVSRVIGAMVRGKVCPGK